MPLAPEMRRIVFIAISALHVLCAVALFIDGFVLMTHEIYGYGPGFFCMAEGLVALICFGWYIQMLRSGEINYDLVIGFSVGLILVFLQGCVLWGALQERVFEERFLQYFISSVEKVQNANGICKNCTSIEEETVEDIGRDHTSEQAAAAFSAIGLITQIALLGIVTVQKTSAGTSTAEQAPGASTYVFEYFAIACCSWVTSCC